MNLTEQAPRQTVDMVNEIIALHNNIIHNINWDVKQKQLSISTKDGRFFSESLHCDETIDMFIRRIGEYLR